MASDRIDASVLAAMRSLPRDRFVPASMRHLADEDEPLPIGYGQTISQPTVVAIMTTALELTGRERVLEIGTGSGFQTALLAGLCAHVYSVEVVARLSERAGGVLSDLGFHNVTLRVGDGYEGWVEHAPFDRIICTAAPPSLPEALLAQLVEGGILVAPVGRYLQELLRVVRRGDDFTEQRLGAVRFVPMVHS
jgi:protein-L-isoaspartate(D-aspartate) O-methyltransferase